MFFRRGGFTLLELMIVMSILGIMIAAIYPQTVFYYARSRDLERLSEIKDLSAMIQDYSRIYSVYPATENANATASGNCVSEIFLWPDALPHIRDKQFSQLWGSWISLKKDPSGYIFDPLFCSVAGSYFYNKMDAYGLVAARMELQVTGANYNTMVDLNNPTKINDLVKAQPLDKDANDPDKIFLIITN